MFQPTLYDILFFLTMSICFCAFIRRIQSRHSKRRSQSLPPGPKGYPILGNVFDLPRAKIDKAWEIYTTWGEKYGGIASAHVPGHTIIIVNDPRIASEMLDNKSSIYSDRPQLPMLSLTTIAQFLPLLPYGPRLKEHRKLVSKVIGTNAAIKTFHPSQEYNASMLTKRILRNPDDLQQAIRKSTAALVLRTAYGYTIKEEGRDMLVDVVDQVVARFNELENPARFLVNLIPALQYLPIWFPFGQAFRHFSNEAREIVREMVEQPMNFVREETAKGTNLPSYVGRLLQESTGQVSEEREYDIKWSAASFFGGGADTTVAVTTTYFLAMTKNPSVQQRIQSEIDSVIGRHRLPSFLDRESLPYAEAVCKECFRWLPVVPQGLPHQSTEDDVQDGYFIPKGSIIFPNIWNMLHDPKTYKDPMSFNPDRFMGSEPERSPYDFVFGFGRRICPGIKLGDASVWINVVRCAASLTIGKAIDASTGREIEPVCGQMPGTLSHPERFQCKIAPRYQEVLDLVEAATVEPL